MAKNNHSINSFVSGEVSQRFFGRTTTQAYNDSCEELTNVLIRPQGGAYKRPGTKYVNKIVDKDGNVPDDAIIIPFVGIDGESWQLVITSEDPLYLPAGLAKLDPTEPRNMYAINVKTEEVHYIGANDAYFNTDIYTGYYFPAGVDISKFQYAQDTTKVYITIDGCAPLVIEYFPENDGSSTAQFKFVVTPYIQGLLLGTAENWRRMPFNEPVYAGLTHLKVTVDGSGNAVLEDGGGTLTATFSADWLGRMFKFTETGTSSATYIVYEYVSSSQVKILAIGGTPQGTSTTKTYGGALTTYYEQGMWDRISGFPRAVVFYDNRLVFGGTDSFPEYQWLSYLQNYEHFDQRGLESDSDFADPLAATDAFALVYRGNNRPNKIAWIQAQKTLVTGTDFSEFIAYPATTDSSLAFDNTRKTLETGMGGAPLQPVRIDNATVFVQRDRRTLRELVYNFNEDSYQATDLSVYNPDICRRGVDTRDSDYLPGGFDNGFQQIVLQQNPVQIMWITDGTGSLYSLVRERVQQVLGWQFHKLAGEYTLKGGLNDGDSFQTYIECLSSVPSPDFFSLGTASRPDEVWMITRRAYQADAGDDCVLTLYVERLAPEWPYSTIDENWSVLSSYKLAPMFMDFCYTTNNYLEATATGVIEDLPFTHGQVVRVLCNGKDFGEYTVDAGTIDIGDNLNGDTVWDVVIGISYTSRVIPMSQEMPAQQGTSQGLIRRAHELDIHFVRSFGARVGVKNDDDDLGSSRFMEDVLFPESATLADPPALFTGVRKMTLDAGYDRRQKLVIESDAPYPMEISHVVMRGVVYE